MAVFKVFMYTKTMFSKNRQIAAAALIVLVGCGGVQNTQDGQALATSPVDLQSWCVELGTVYCRSLADRCFGGISDAAESCYESFEPSCLAGRAPSTSSGRTSAELAYCSNLIESLSCEELGGIAGNVEFLDNCQAGPAHGH